MKKTYEEFEMEIFIFEQKDAIVASSALSGDHDNAFLNFDSFFNF